MPITILANFSSHHVLRFTVATGHVMTHASSSLIRIRRLAPHECTVKAPVLMPSANNLAYVIPTLAAACEGDTAMRTFVGVVLRGIGDCTHGFSMDIVRDRRIPTTGIDGRSSSSRFGPVSF